MITRDSGRYASKQDSIAYLYWDIDIGIGVLVACVSAPSRFAAVHACCWADDF